MSLGSLPPESFMKIAGDLPLLDLLRLSVSSKSMKAMSMKVADSSVEAQLDGLDGVCFPRTRRACIDHNARLRRILLCAALRPYYVARGCQQHWPDITIPFRFSLDTRGPLCLEFQVHVAKAINGTPKIGFVDAEDPFVQLNELSEEFLHRWSGDICNGQGDPDAFAIAVEPECGMMRATKGALPSQHCTNSAYTKNKREYYTAKLKWEQLGDSMQKWNSPIHAAFGFKEGKLTFYRMIGNGTWESSGVIHEGLPRKVLPCVFMASFIGYAKIKFLRLSKNIPAVSLKGDCSTNSGFQNGWRRIVR